MSNIAGMTSSPTCFLHLRFCVLLSWILLCVAIGSTAQAGTAITETTGAGNLGTHVLPPSGQVYGITDGTPVGNNLYHSFAQFNVATGDIAQFQTATLLPNSTLGNILARVTGGNPSSIFGTVDSIRYYPNANLFLMNPNGIIFGPGAQLNVGGMANFTTADYLRLDAVGGPHAGIFHADMTQTSVLTNAPVTAFGFLGSNPAAIAVQGSRLTVASGTGLSLIGGNQGFTYIDPDTGNRASVPDGVTVTGGRLSAADGEINLVSVASPGEILLSGLKPAPNINGDSFTSFGPVTISGGSLLDVSGSLVGTVRIRSGQFVLDGSSIFTNTAGNVVDEAHTAVEIHAQGDAILRNASEIRSLSEGARRSGDIEITAGTLRVLDGSKIFSGSSGSAPAGNIVITASNSVSLTGTDSSGVGSSITSESSDFCGCTESAGSVSITASSLTLDDQAIIQTRALGNRRAGDITLDLGNLTVRNGSAIQTSGSDLASSGTIRITAAGTIALSGQFDSDTPSRIRNLNDGTGGTGAIVLKTRSLSLEGGARIWNEMLSSLDPGQDSKITIVASDNVNLSGGSSIRVLNVDSNVGGIDISGRSITLTDQSAIGTVTFGDGNAGPINITANNLSILSGSTVESSTSTNTGLGGDITIHLTGKLSLMGQAIGRFGEVIGSNISSSTIGSGDGGQIIISANSTQISGGALINTSTFGTGNAGNVTIQGLASPVQSVLIDGSGSGIFTDTQGTGAGGNILIETSQSTTLTNGAAVSASSTGTMDNAGNAGMVTIHAGNTFFMQNSSVTTQATKSGGGQIEINAANLFRLVNSRVSSSVLDGTGGGGNISIDPNVLVLQNSQILAKAIQGAGGNITITTPLFLADSSSLVSASSQFGLNGTVTIQSPTSNLSGSLGTLTSKPSQAQSLLTQRCAALANGQASSFVVAGREQLPADPGNWLTSPIALAGLGESLDAGDAAASAPAVMAMAAQNSGTVSLRRLTPAGFLIANFADSEATGCHS